MKIVALECISLRRAVEVHAGAIQWLWVKVHTDEGLYGLGETYPHAESELAALRRFAPLLLGADPREIEALWHRMFEAVSYSGWAGAEMRALSAVDIALWDLFGKYTGQPVYRLLGGACREQIPIYNTCYDWIDFNLEPVRLAKELLAEGIAGMKIWPFDSIARQTEGQWITPEQIQQGLAPLAAIRAELGDSIQVAMEFHGYWNFDCARRICQALEPLNPWWIEEILPQDNLKAYKELAAVTRLPLAISERLQGRFAYRELLELGAASIVQFDLCWCGGFTEARKIAAMASAYQLPIAPHNCGGPVLHQASVHLAAHLRNLLVLETVRRHYREAYAGLVAGLAIPVSGKINLPQGAGLGIELNPEVLKRPDAVVEWIR